MNFGNNLRNTRLLEGMTQHVLAQKIGVTQGAIAQWEARETPPAENQTIKLRELLGQFDQLPTEQTNNEAELDDRSAFGEWLITERQKKGLSVSALAAKCGLTSATIYNLEAGRSKNPQEATRKLLETALSVSIPDAVNKATEDEASIAGLGQLTTFNPHDSKDWPTCPGVYVFYDISDRPIYVGKAKNIRVRVSGHLEKFWFREPIVSNSASYVKIENDANRHQVEQILIKFMRKNAVLNKQSVDRRDEDEGE